jgi:hypothetical protein
MLVNRDFNSPHAVRIVFHDDAAQVDREFGGLVEVMTFGKAQYRWHSGRRNGYADPDSPPVSAVVNANPGALYTLPPASLNIIRGRLAN